MTDTGASSEPPDILYHFVDEAGQPTLFNGKGKLIAGTEVCSRFFMLGKLEVDEPAKLEEALASLHSEIITDPYFTGIPQLRPDDKRTRKGFHAKDDPIEVRYSVFRLLRSFGPSLRFYAVVRDKLVLADEEKAKRSAKPGYRYRENDLYDGLTRELYNKFHRLGDELHITYAERGNSDRTKAFEAALSHAENDVASKYGLTKKMPRKVIRSNPRQSRLLQAVDYFLWALQRFYEEVPFKENGIIVGRRREDRFLRSLWNQVGEIHDMDFLPHKSEHRGAFYRQGQPLELATRFPEGKKIPRI
ncbi:MAG: DUF3800 domain-containing protein [Opitutaceae bacterium]|jgi:hypothetical protein